MNYNFVTTQYQRSVAKDLLSQISLVDPSAILAGGAVRDWYLGKPANDLDIYVRCPNHETYSEKVSMLKNIGLIYVNKLSKNSEVNYASLPGLLHVFEGHYCNMKVNIMFMSANTYSERIIENFDCSICECFMNKDGEYFYSNNFFKTIESKVIFVNERYTGNEQHLIKMAERFPEYLLAKIIKRSKKEIDSFEKF